MLFFKDSPTLNSQLPLLKWKDGSQIIDYLKAGKSCLIPTETVVGLMGNLDSELLLNQIKKSPDQKPLSHFVANLEQAQQIWNQTVIGADKLARAFWPGPLTLIAGQPSKGIRMPLIPPLLELLKQSGPTFCTSANFSGAPAPATMAEVDPELIERVDFIIDEPAPQSSGCASTILIHDHNSNKWQAIREGSITQAQWQEALK